MVFKNLVELSLLIELLNDIAPTHEFTLNIKLGNGGPVAVFLDALAHFGVVEHVEGLELVDAAGFEHLHRAARKAAHRKLRVALHEEHHL